MQATELAALVRCPEGEVTRTLEGLEHEYAESGRGFELRQVAGGWRFYTRGDCAEVVERYLATKSPGGQAKAVLDKLQKMLTSGKSQPVDVKGLRKLEAAEKAHTDESDCIGEFKYASNRDMISLIETGRL